MLKLPPGSFVKGTDEYLVDVCPSCNKTKHFYWNIKKQVGICHSCKYTISGYKAFKAAFDEDIDTHLAEYPITLDVGKYPKLSTLFLGNAWDFPEGQKFLRSRFVTEQVARKAPILFRDKCLCIEIDPVSPEFESAVLYRSPTGWPSKFISEKGTRKAFYCYGLRHIAAEFRTPLIVEGAFDLLTPDLLGYGIALLGTSCSDAVLAFLHRRFDFLTVWLDPDEAGLIAKSVLAKKFEEWNIKHRFLEIPKEPKVFYAGHPLISKLKAHLHTI